MPSVAPPCTRSYINRKDLLLSDALEVDAPQSAEASAIAEPLPAAVPPAAEGDSLKSKAVRGTAWGVGGQTISMVLRLVSNLTLTRLLSPEIFGLMALISSLLIGLHMITDVGVNSSIMRSPRGEEPRFLHTAFTVQVVRGLAVAVCFTLLGYPMARFYEDDRLFWTVIAAGIIPALHGFVSTRQSLAMRHMDVRRNTMVDLASQVVQLGVNIALALWLRSIWALVIGGMVQTTTMVLLTHLYLPGARDRFGWDKAAAKELYEIAKWITLSSATAFLASRFDVMALGKLITKDNLGVYSQAVFVASMPYVLVAPLVDSVLLPAMSAQLRAGEAGFGEATRRSRGVVLHALMLLFLGAGLAAPGFYYVALDPRYHDAGWQAQLCITAVWFMCLSESASRILLALGTARPMAVGNLVRFGGTAVGVLAGFHFFGLPGAVLGSAVGPLIAHGVMLANLRQMHVHLIDIELKYTLLCFSLLAFGAYLPHWIAPRVGIASELVSIGTGIAILIPLGLSVLKRTRGAFRRPAT